MKLNRKLLLGFLGMAALIWVVGVATVEASRDALRKSIEQNSQEYAEALMRALDRDVQSRTEFLRQYAEGHFLHEVLRASNAEFADESDPAALIAERDEVWQARQEGEANPLLDTLRAAPLSRDMQARLVHFREEYGYDLFGEMFVTNAYGANVAQTNRTSDYRQDDEEWWQRARRERLVIGEVAYDESAGVYALDVSTRVDDEGGAFLGVIKASLNLAQVIQIVSTSERVGQRDVHLLDARARVIHSTRAAEIFSDGSQFLPDGKLDARTPSGTFERSDPELGDLTGVFARSQGFREYQGKGWVLVIEAPTEVLLGPVERLRNFVLLTALAVSVLAIGIAVALSRSVSRTVTQGIQDISSTTAEFVVVASESAEQATDQFAAVNEITTTVDELDTISRESAEQAEAAAVGTRSVLELAEECSRQVTEQQSAMTDLSGKVDSLGREMTKLSDHTQQIKQVTNMVSDIASQTNLLALNAAVEAARSGEHGRGFVVVAGEIRALADANRQRAKEIHELITNVLAATTASVKATESGQATLGQVVEISEDSATLLHQIADQTRQASHNVDAISANTRQQAAASKQVAEGMSAIHTGARSTNAAVGQIKEGIEVINKAAENLRSLI